MVDPAPDNFAYVKIIEQGKYCAWIERRNDTYHQIEGLRDFDALKDSAFHIKLFDRTPWDPREIASVVMELKDRGVRVMAFQERDYYQTTGQEVSTYFDDLTEGIEFFEKRVSSSPHHRRIENAAKLWLPCLGGIHWNQVDGVECPNPAFWHAGWYRSLRHQYRQVYMTHISQSDNWACKNCGQA
jgi:hypothetical protein